MPNNTIRESEHPVYRKCSYSPDSKVYGVNMGHIWGRQEPSGPHVDPMNLSIWEGD